MATNEELAALAKDGDAAALLELWNQTQRLAWKFMDRWIWAAECAGMETADCEQAAFLGLLRAVKAFDSASGFRFSTYFVRSVQNEFSAAAGMHTEKAKRDPLRYAFSLDMPVSEDAEDCTLAEAIPDPLAAEAFDRAEAFAALEPYLSTLPANQQAALYQKFWLEIPTDSKALSAALRNLRHPRNSKHLKPLLYGENR